MRRNLTLEVAALFRAKPGVWIDGNEIAKVGGCYAYRTRISNARRQFGMHIINRVERDQQGVATSLYKFVPESDQMVGQ